MKRFYFAAVVAFAMLLLSCIDDKSTISNGKAWVTFDVAAEQIGTRVYGDGVAANDLEYAIYEKDKYDAPLIEDEIVGAFAGDVMQTSFSEKLAVGKSYVVLFWADAEQDPYTVDWNNQTIKITDPDALAAQNENLDAFFAKHEVKVTGPQTEPVELRRPFAQLNIGTADTADAQAAGLMVKKSEVTVQAYTTLNLMNGSVDDAMELTYEMANIPSGENKTFTVKGKSYDNLSMNYLLVNTKELVTVKFTTNDGAENVNTATYAQVPVERNYKTFIVGNLLTSAVNIDIIILPDWGKNDHIYDGNIIVEKSEVTSYKSGADETVEFTSKEAWTAQVVAGAMRADESDDSWCSVEPTSGEAGDAEITITTQPNDTGEDRTATVVITAGESTQEITVTQLATTKPAEEDDSPVPSNQIWYTTTDGNVVTPYKTDVFGAAITSNTYEDGKGVITFDGEVTAVGKDAFYRGTGATLETITLPKSVTEIGDYAFSNCSALKNISMRNGITKIGKSAFYSCQELTNIILPNSLIEIGENAFKSSGLTSITIPESVTIVGDTAFLSCENLSAFYGKGATDDNRCLVIDGVIKAFAPANYESDIYTIPYGATTVGYNAFSNLTILTEIIIPESITTIDRYAFASNNGLLTVTLPKNITTIGMSAFQRCQNLATVYCKSATPSTLSSNVFFGNAEGLKIYVPTESVEAYKTANGWSEYADYIFANPSTEGDDEEEYDKVGDPDFQAAIGNNKFVTLQEALNEVEDNQTITLLNRIDLEVGEVLKIYRSIDFTLDLNGYRIHSYGKDGSVTAGQYVGMIDINTSKSTDVKDATITIKDGFLTYDGKSMIGVSGSADAKTVVNLENVTISGAIDAVETTSPLMGSAIVIGHSNVTVNLKNGTKISNSREVPSNLVNVSHYSLINVCCGTLNIYEGVEFIYSHVEHANNISRRQMVVISDTAGHTNTAVVNVYGGYGRVAGSCFTMGHNGGLFNIYGGEWIANTDGSMPKPSLNSGYAVQDPAVVALDGPYGYTVQSVANIYGGILRGRFHCGWARGSGNPAELYISGGNFNADPTVYVVEGHTATQNSQGYWEVYEN